MTATKPAPTPDDQTEPEPKRRGGSRPGPRKGSWTPVFLGLEDNRTPEQLTALAKRLERHIRETKTT